MVCNGLPIPVVDICIDSLIGVGFLLLSLVGAVIGLRSAWAWVRSLLLRAAIHHVIFGLGLAGVGIEVLTDIGIVATVLDVIESLIGIAL